MSTFFYFFSKIFVIADYAGWAGYLTGYRIVAETLALVYTMAGQDTGQAVLPDVGLAWASSLLIATYEELKVLGAPDGEVTECGTRWYCHLSVFWTGLHGLTRLRQGYVGQA